VPRAAGVADEEHVVIKVSAGAGVHLLFEAADTGASEGAVGVALDEAGKDEAGGRTGFSIAGVLVGDCTVDDTDVAPGAVWDGDAVQVEVYGARV
jgi:hypothetical protein